MRITSHGKLNLMLACIYAIFIQWFAMCCNFSDLALLQHNDAIGFFDGGQTMSDDQSGSALHQSFQYRLHMAFGFAIQCRGDFIENKERCILENSACNGDTLALAAGEFDTTLTDQSI